MTTPPPAPANAAETESIPWLRYRRAQYRPAVRVSKPRCCAHARHWSNGSSLHFLGCDAFFCSALVTEVETMAPTARRIIAKRTFTLFSCFPLSEEGSLKTRHQR
jgi:hypothetical protein